MEPLEAVTRCKVLLRAEKIVWSGEAQEVFWGFSFGWGRWDIFNSSVFTTSLCYLQNFQSAFCFLLSFVENEMKTRHEVNTV